MFGSVLSSGLSWLRFVMVWIGLSFGLSWVALGHGLDCLVQGFMLGWRVLGFWAGLSWPLSAAGLGGTGY